MFDHSMNRTRDRSHNLERCLPILDSLCESCLFFVPVMAACDSTHPPWLIVITQEASAYATDIERHSQYLVTKDVLDTGHG